MYQFNFIKLFIFLALFLSDINCSEKELIFGKVVFLENEKIELILKDSKNIQKGNRFNLSYKTIFGDKIDVGKWKVENIKKERIQASIIQTKLLPEIGRVYIVELLSSNSSNGNNSKLLVSEAKRIANEIEVNNKTLSSSVKMQKKKQVVEYIQQAASQGNGEAYFLLALLYEDGYGKLKADISKMVESLIESANHDYSDAQYMVGEMYEDGDEVKKDRNKAIYWYERAAMQGHKEAKIKLLKINPSLRGKEPINYGFGKERDIDEMLKLEN